MHRQERVSLLFGAALLALTGTLLLLTLLGKPPPARAHPATTTRYVAITGRDSLSPAIPNDCIDIITPCRTLQYAVDQAQTGDEIHVATGVYTGVQARSGVTQVVYISKTITVQGGYTPTFAGPPDPVAYPTTLDAEGKGRVIYISGTITVALEGVRLTNGSISGNGGGIYAENAHLIISACQIFSNSATSFGSGVYLKDGTNATLTGNQVYSNKRQGLYFSNSPTATLTDNKIYNNTWGGVSLYLSDNVALVNNEVYNNTALTGGGIYVSHSDNVALVNNEVYNNTAWFEGGGGIYLSRSTNATLTSNQVYNNTASASGGGIYLTDSPTATLVSNWVHSNTANHGGGISLLSSANATLMSNMVVENRIRDSGQGAGIFALAADIHLLHTTLARNSGGYGQGIYVMAGTIRMTNTILVSHTVGIENDITMGGMVALTYTLWGTGTWANGSDTMGSDIFTGTLATNWWDEPDFMNPDGGDYHLDHGSAAIDAGLYAGVDSDIDGDPRPVDGNLDGTAVVDLGADEFTLRRIYLPLVLCNHQ